MPVAIAIRERNGNKSVPAVFQRAVVTRVLDADGLKGSFRDKGRYEGLALRDRL
jgi:hypothetical protein